MLTAWVLIILTFGNDPHAYSVDFNTQEACEAAASQLDFWAVKPKCVHRGEPTK